MGPNEVTLKNLVHISTNLSQAVAKSHPIRRFTAHLFEGMTLSIIVAERSCPLIDSGSKTFQGVACRRLEC